MVAARTLLPFGVWPEFSPEISDNNNNQSCHVLPREIRSGCRDLGDMVTKRKKIIIIFFEPKAKLQQSVKDGTCHGALLRENFSENRHTPRPHLRILRIIGISFVVVTGTSAETWARHVARMHEKPKAYDKKKEDWYIWAGERSKQISSIRISVPRLELVGRLPAGSRSCSSQL